MNKVMISLILLISLSGCSAARSLFGIQTPTVPTYSSNKVENQPIATQSLNLLMYGGVAFVLIGICLAVLLKLFAKAVMCIGAGAGLLATTFFVERFPWVLYILGAGVLFFLGYIFYINYLGKQHQIALKTIVEGVNLLPVDINEKVREKIADTAGIQNVTVKKVVDNIKKKSGWVDVEEQK